VELGYGAGGERPWPKQSRGEAAVTKEEEAGRSQKDLSAI
jgi:hypothetical protein